MFLLQHLQMFYLLPVPIINPQSLVVLVLDVVHGYVADAVLPPGVVAVAG